MRDKPVQLQVQDQHEGSMGRFNLKHCDWATYRSSNNGNTFKSRDESKWVEQELEDEDSQTWFWRRRPDGFAVNEKEHIIYILEFKRVSDAGERYVAKTQRVVVKDTQ